MSRLGMPSEKEESGSFSPSGLHVGDLSSGLGAVPW